MISDKVRPHHWSARRSSTCGSRRPIRLGACAIDAVNSHAKSGQPFLISLHFNAPHWPWEAPGDEAESKRVAGTN